MWVSGVLYSHRMKSRCGPSCSLTIQATNHRGLAALFQAHGVVAGYLHCRKKVPVSLGHCQLLEAKSTFVTIMDTLFLKPLVVEFPSC